MTNRIHTSWLTVLALAACPGSDPVDDPAAKSDGGAGMTASACNHAGCDSGPDTNDAGLAEPFAPGSFSAEHETEIRHDCQESLQCRAQQGQELPENPTEQCVRDTAEVLDSADADRQQAFLRKYTRCRDFIVCEYYSCVTSQ